MKNDLEINEDLGVVGSAVVGSIAIILITKQFIENTIPTHTQKEKESALFSLFHDKEYLSRITPLVQNVINIVGIDRI